MTAQQRIPLQSPAAETVWAYAWTDRGLAYVPVPKAACSSVKWALFQARRLPMPGSIDDIHSAPWPEKIPLPQLAQTQPWLLTFSVVRNPFDRLVSCWASKICNQANFSALQRHRDRLRPGMTFDAFARGACTIADDQANEHLRSQHEILSADGCLLVETIMKLERLEQDWFRFARDKHLPRLRRLNASAHAKYRDHYTPELRRLVAQRYRDDLDAFAYAF